MNYEDKKAKEYNNFRKEQQEYKITKHAAVTRDSQYIRDYYARQTLKNQYPSGISESTDSQYALANSSKMTLQNQISQNSTDSLQNRDTFRKDTLQSQNAQNNFQTRDTLQSVKKQSVTDLPSPELVKRQSSRDQRLQNEFESFQNLFPDNEGEIDSKSLSLSDSIPQPDTLDNQKKDQDNHLAMISKEFKDSQISNGSLNNANRDSKE